MAINLRDKAQTKVLDGVTYEAWPLPTGLQKKILTKIIRGMAAAEAAFSSGDPAVIAKALPDEDIDFIAAKFGDASAYVNEEGKNAPLVAAAHDLHFAGRLDVYLRWILFCAEVNFSGFFDTERRKALGDDFDRFKRMATGETTETTATG